MIPRPPANPAMLAFPNSLTAAPENSGLAGDAGCAGLAVLSGAGWGAGAGAGSGCTEGTTTIGANVLGATGATVPLLKGPGEAVKFSGAPEGTMTGTTVIGATEVSVMVTTWAMLPQVLRAKSLYSVARQWPSSC